MSSVEFIGPTKALALDLEPFIENPEKIPHSVEVGLLEQMQKAVERLFEIPPRGSFASFKEPPKFSLKKIFKERIVSDFDIDKAIEIIDEHLEGKEGDNEEILAMLYKLIDLDHLLKDIRNRMQSILKS
jgi:hypothetical protein